MHITSQFEPLAALPAGEATNRLRSILVTLSRDPGLWTTHIRPLAARTHESEAITIVPLSTPSSMVSVQLFLWSPGAETQIHDHASWGAFGCVIGSLSEERYVRLDDGARLNVARLRKAWQRVWTSANGISTLLPFSGGIHRVRNESDTIAISLHCYGPPGEIDGRDYDPEQDYVCDRAHEPLAITDLDGR